MVKIPSISDAAIELLLDKWAVDPTLHESVRKELYSIYINSFNYRSEAAKKFNTERKKRIRLVIGRLDKSINELNNFFDLQTWEEQIGPPEANAYRKQSGYWGADEETEGAIEHLVQSQEKFIKILSGISLEKGGQEMTSLKQCIGDLVVLYESVSTIPFTRQNDPHGNDLRIHNVCTEVIWEILPELGIKTDQTVDAFIQMVINLRRSLGY